MIHLTRRWTGLVLSVVFLISCSCSVLRLKSAQPPHREGGTDLPGVRMTIYATPLELSGVEFTIFNPEAGVKIEEQKPGWYRISMEVYVQEDDAGLLLLRGLEIEVLSEKDDLQHVRIRGWIPAEAFSQPSLPVQDQDIRLEVIEWAWRVVPGGVMINGVVRNNGGDPVQDAQITVSATDELGQPLIPRTVRLKPDSLYPGNTAHFGVQLDAIYEPSRIYARFKLSAKKYNPPVK